LSRSALWQRLGEIPLRDRISSNQLETVKNLTVVSLKRQNNNLKKNENIILLHAYYLAFCKL